MLDALKRYKAQLGDAVWSLLGLTLMNAMAQLLVYPLFAKWFGEEGYGDIQYLMAYINVTTVSVGTAANLARMVAPAKERVSNNGDYNLFLLIVCLLGVPFTVLISKYGGVAMNTSTRVCYYLLFVSMAFRYYADVAYKITLNYRRYFFYYLCISIGYVVGVCLTAKSGNWPLGLLVGEFAGVVYAYTWGRTLRQNALRITPGVFRVFRAILVLLAAEVISAFIFNVDRLLLKWLIDATAVTVYYLATLVGKTMSLITGPLNSVMIGYLARYEGDLTSRAMRWISVGGIALTLLCTGGCILGGYIVLMWLYPAQLDAVKGYLLLGSLAQVLYFITGFIAVVLVRFAKGTYQVYINVAYAVAFFGIGIPATVYDGLRGFSLAMVAAGMVRYAVVVYLGFHHIRQTKRKGSELVG